MEEIDKEDPKAKKMGDGAKELAEDDIEGKADDSDRDETDTENETFDAETLASVDESFDAQTELRKYITKYKVVILKGCEGGEGHRNNTLSYC
jgi:hypothetical protein